VEQAGRLAFHIFRCTTLAPLTYLPKVGWLPTAFGQNEPPICPDTSSAGETIGPGQRGTSVLEKTDDVLTPTREHIEIPLTLTTASSHHRALKGSPADGLPVPTCIEFFGN